MTQRLVAIGVHLPPEQGQPPAHIPDVEWLSGDDVHFSAIAFDASRSTADPELIRRAVAARAALTAADTFIAIRYGLSVASGEELRTRCAASIPRWRRRLSETRGLVEMTLKVASATRVAGSRPDRRDFTSGKAYLEALTRFRAAAPMDESFKSAVETLFEPHTRATKWISRADGGQEFVMLVPRDAFAATRDAALQLKTSQSGVPFLLSGPWPLEEFADGE